MLIVGRDNRASSGQVKGEIALYEVESRILRA